MDRLSRTSRNMAKTIRSGGTKWCWKGGGLTSCATCEISIDWARDTADALERHAKSWEIYMKTSKQASRCKNKVELDSFVKCVVAASEHIILDLDQRLRKSMEMTFMKHRSTDLFFSDTEYQSVSFSTHWDKPSFGCWKMQLRMSQLEYLTSVVELLEEARRHAVQRKIHDGGSCQILEVADKIISTRSSLLADERPRAAYFTVLGSSDKFPNISTVTDDLPGFNDGNISLTVLLSHWYEPSNTSTASLEMHDEKNGLDARGISHADVSGTLNQLLQDLHLATTAPNRQYARFVKDLQSLKAQHEVLLRNAEKLTKQVSEIQKTDGKVPDDVSTAPSILGYICEAGSDIRCSQSGTRPALDKKSSADLDQKDDHSTSHDNQSLPSAPPPYSENVATRTSRLFGSIRSPHKGK